MSQLNLFTGKHPADTIIERINSKIEADKTDKKTVKMISLKDELGNYL